MPQQPLLKQPAVSLMEFTSFPLAPLDSPEAVPQAIAQSLHFSFSKEGDHPPNRLLDYLRHKRMLLLLDNFEHLIEERA